MYMDPYLDSALTATGIRIRFLWNIVKIFCLTSKFNIVVDRNQDPRPDSTLYGKKNRILAKTVIRIRS